MKTYWKIVLACILAMVMMLAILPMPAGMASQASEPGIVLGSATLSASKYYYNSATVTGEDIRTILISFSDSVTGGDAIVLPATPGGFTVSASSAGNNYSKRINLNAGIASSDVQNYIRGVGFTIASQTQTVQITVATEDVTQDTFYNVDTGHYYQFISDTSSTWLQAYDAAKAATYRGRSGYLATVTSLNEDIFINSLSGGNTGWLGGTILSNAGTSADPLYYNGFNINSVVHSGWYWACGPERGITFFDVDSLFPFSDDPAYAAEIDALNTAYFYNWARYGITNEPNSNAEDVLEEDVYRTETCLTTLQPSDGRIGKHGTLFSWNDISYDHTGTDDFAAKGYFVEYGNQIIGDSGSDSNTFASASGTLERAYTATVNTRLNGTLAAAPGSVELKQSGTTMYTASSGATGVYTASAINGTYDVYINNEDTGKDITINNGNGSVTVNYYTVSFAVSNAGTASGSTISATAGGSSITSGAVVLAGKSVTITAAGAGAATYTYLWSGMGTSGQTTAAITIASLSGAVNASCIVTGTAAPTYRADIYTTVDGVYTTAPGIVELKQGSTTVYTVPASGTPGLYRVQALNGTYDIYINNENTGLYIYINGANAGVQVDYYTVSYAVSNTGTAVGSTVSATAGGAPIASGTAVLPGKVVTITAAGAGADSYTYLWSGTGTSGETTAALTIPSLSSTVDALCAVTGTTTYEANVYTATDAVWGSAPGVVELKQGGVTKYTAASNGTGRYTAYAVNGTYDVFINNEDTEKDILISNANAGVTVNYYTVSFAVQDGGAASGSTISAITRGAVPVTSGTVLLANKGVRITASGAGADSYAYAWTGPGSNFESGPVFQFLTIPGPLDVLCTVTGSNTPASCMAGVLTYINGVLSAAPGSVELWQDGSAVYTLTSPETGVYIVQADNGTYDVYINNEDTGKDIVVAGTDIGVQVDYYTVSFSAADAGTASGSTISATAGGTPVASGTAVLSGKTVDITAAGAGATTYTYLWSGQGTSGETTTDITIPSLSATVNALCTVIGTTTQQTYAADIYTAVDGVYTTAPGIVELKQGGTTVYTVPTSGTPGLYRVQAVNGTYDIYINNEDTGFYIYINSANAGVQVDYYTVSFAVNNLGTASGSTISATAGGTPVASGTAVLSGKAVAITTAGAGATTYTYLWSGQGTSGETTDSLTISSLSGTVNALCTVTGTANVYAPGTLEEEEDDITIIADGLLTQDARLYHSDAGGRYQSRVAGSAAKRQTDRCGF